MVILRKVFNEIDLKLLTGHIVEVVYAGKTVVGQLSSCMTSDLQFACISQPQDTMKKPFYNGFVIPNVVVVQITSILWVVQLLSKSF